MPKYATFFTFKCETVASMIDRPSDRIAAANKVANAVGARVEAYYWMTGPNDGFIIVDAPDMSAVVAASLAVAGSGEFAHLETYEVFPAGEFNALLGKARLARDAYRQAADEARAISIR